MGQTTFSGPIKAGAGHVVAAQSAPWVQSTTAASTGIVIPAGSQILEIQFSVDTAPEAGNISVGTSATSTELLTALAAGTSANVFLFGSAATITDVDVWENVGTSDVTIWVDCSAGTTGRGTVTVSYLQAIGNA